MEQDTLPRRNAARHPRRRFTVDHKRRIAQQSLLPGTSVSRLAREHDVNANQVFKWRGLYLRGLLGGVPDAVPQLLAVTVSDAAASMTAPATMSTTMACPRQDGLIELHLPQCRICLHGAVNGDVLRILLASLTR